MWHYSQYNSIAYCLPISIFGCCCCSIRCHLFHSVWRPFSSCYQSFILVWIMLFVRRNSIYNRGTKRWCPFCCGCFGSIILFLSNDQIFYGWNHMACCLCDVHYSWPRLRFIHRAKEFHFSRQNENSQIIIQWYLG